MKYLWRTIGLVVLAACTHTPEQQIETQDTSPPTFAATGIAVLDFYSSFMGEETKQLCDKTHIECTDDPIEPQLWFDILSESLKPTVLNKTGSDADYEILVASQLRSTKVKQPSGKTLSAIFSPSAEPNSQSLHSEFTIQWRGFALNTYHTSTPYNEGDSLLEKANTMLSRWQDHASALGLFSRDFLYSSLKASNYKKDLIIPAQLGEFYLEDTQLYPDPFRGVVARYRHPKFTSAILDINVSPILLSLDKVDKQWLQLQINQDLVRAQEVAESHNMAFDIDKQIAIISLAQTGGHYFSVHAVDEFSEPLYAATYLFQQQDKLVKFTTNFPHDVATPLVEEALHGLQVPKESELMIQMRALF